MDDKGIDILVADAEAKNKAWLKELAVKMYKEAQEFTDRTGLDLADTTACDGSDFGAILAEAADDCSNVPELLLLLAERIRMRSC
jgi:hypothetical protein